VEQSIMNSIAASPRQAWSAGGLSSLVAAAVLLGACQQPSSSGPSQSSAYEQKMSVDFDAKRERHCCRHAGKGGGR
jgi:hypothetical protein